MGPLALYFTLLHHGRRIWRLDAEAYLRLLPLGRHRGQVCSAVCTASRLLGKIHWLRSTCSCLLPRDPRLRGRRVSPAKASSTPASPPACSRDFFVLAALAAHERGRLRVPFMLPPMEIRNVPLLSGGSSRTTRKHPLLIHGKRIQEKDGRFGARARPEKTNNPRRTVLGQR